MFDAFSLVVLLIVVLWIGLRLAVRIGHANQQARARGWWE